MWGHLLLFLYLHREGLKMPPRAAGRFHGLHSHVVLTGCFVHLSLTQPKQLLRKM